ncbi:DMT family transporter [Phaeacidiphilus oryzae]|uniref:DMT family transporter n=1 Tax=Phaeacidiphilus oryzae TaxID=348818 RepID=UPI0007C727B1|nr:DMT family transporter [Phaeacidiphilus oryzae]
MKPVLAAALAATLVGTSFVAGSVLTHYPFLGGQGARYLLSALLLAALAGRRGLSALGSLTPRQWGRLAVLAGSGMVGFSVAVLCAERTAEPAVPGVLVGCAPLVVAIAAPLLDRRRPSERPAGAAVLVVAGAAVVQGFGRTDAAGLGYSLLALAGEAAFGLVAVPLVAPRGPLGPVALSAGACALAGVEALAAGVVADGWGGVLPPPSGRQAAALAWLLVVTVVGFCCWYYAVGRLGPERAALFSGVIPVAAALFAPMAGTGALGPGQLAGSGLVAAGVTAGVLAGRGSGRRTAGRSTAGRRLRAGRTGPPAPPRGSPAPRPGGGCAPVPGGRRRRSVRQR